MINLYCIYDLDAQEAGPLFEAKNDAVAQRNFSSVVSNSTTPDRFTLYRVGTWDSESMVVSSTTPISLANLGDINAVKEI